MPLRFVGRRALPDDLRKAACDVGARRIRDGGFAGARCAAGSRQNDLGQRLALDGRQFDIGARLADVEGLVFGPCVVIIVEPVEFAVGARLDGIGVAVDGVGALRGGRGVVLVVIGERRRGHIGATREVEHQMRRIDGLGAGRIAAAQVDLRAAAAGDEPHVVDGEHRHFVDRILHVEIVCFVLQLELRRGEHPVFVGLRIGVSDRLPIGAVGAEREMEFLGFEFVVVETGVVVDRFRVLCAEGELQILCAVELDLVDNQRRVVRSEEGFVLARCAFVAGAGFAGGTDRNLAFAGVGDLGGAGAGFRPARVVGDQRFVRYVGRAERFVVDGVAGRRVRLGTPPSLLLRASMSALRVGISCGFSR